MQTLQSTCASFTHEGPNTECVYSSVVVWHSDPLTQCCLFCDVTRFKWYSYISTVSHAWKDCSALWLKLCACKKIDTGWQTMQVHCNGKKGAREWNANAKIFFHFFTDCSKKQICAALLAHFSNASFSCQFIQHTIMISLTHKQWNFQWAIKKAGYLNKKGIWYARILLYYNVGFRWELPPQIRSKNNKNPDSNPFTTY